ncbi:hypothetical protein A2U01_0107241, partial [Trifolium medium]|nr:hypothetical protein [Trifolium medium]
IGKDRNTPTDEGEEEGGGSSSSSLDELGKLRERRHGGDWRRSGGAQSYIHLHLHSDHNQRSSLEGVLWW